MRQENTEIAYDFRLFDDVQFIREPIKKRPIISRVARVQDVISAIRTGYLAPSKTFGRFLDIDDRLDIFPQYDAGADGTPIEFSYENLIASLVVSINVGVSNITPESWMLIGGSVRDVACLTYCLSQYIPVKYSARPYGFFPYFAEVSKRVLCEDIATMYDLEQFNLEAMGVVLEQDRREVIFRKYGNSVVL
jgi:hypothetical protein